ncbi:MAG: J domain-containing protein [Dehalococcoidia bacterium]|nr:J domain-containing protein [Dehalococcoidia bacterium]
MRKYHYYEVLELSREATQEDINASFRRLARLWHPDRNPGKPEAEATFRRINTAYQVLVDEKSRAEYDRCPVECPTCGTHEVIAMNYNRWQCKHCGCRFDVAGSPELQAIDAPQAPPLRRIRFRAFQATQCSWCARFYDREPFLCPYSTPQTNCDAFSPLTESDRKAKLSNPAWPALVDEWLRPSAERGLIKKCTYCGALNPNVSRMNEPCWKCHKPLRDECPHCGLPMMLYDIEQGTWRCANSQCNGRRFDFDRTTDTWNTTVQSSPAPRRSSRKRRPSQPGCPHCGAGLVYSDQQELWCCVVCRNFFTPDQIGRAAPSDAPIPERAPRKRKGSAPRRQQPPVWDYSHTAGSGTRKRKEKTTGDYVLLAAAIGLIIILGILVILGMSGNLG